MSAKDERAAALMNVIVDAQQALAALNTLPSEDDYPHGAMIKMVIRGAEDREYTYLLLKIQSNVVLDGGPSDGLWYHTGQRMHDGLFTTRPIRGWLQLMRWVTRLRVVSWEQLEVMRLAEPVNKLNDSGTAAGSSV